MEAIDILCIEYAASQTCDSRTPIEEEFEIFKLANFLCINNN